MEGDPGVARNLVIGISYDDLRHRSGIRFSTQLLRLVRASTLSG